MKTKFCLHAYVGRLSQIACMVMTMHVTCTQTVLHVHENSCTVLIPLCENNLNLPRCFFLSVCFVTSSRPLYCRAYYLAALIFLFVCFYRSWFCSPIIKQIYLGQFKCWFAFILPCRRENYHGTGPLCLHINYTSMISELYQHMCSYNKILLLQSWNRP